MERFSGTFTVADETVFCFEKIAYEKGREKKVKAQISFTKDLKYEDIECLEKSVDTVVNAVREKIEELKANADNGNNQCADSGKGAKKGKKKGR